MYAAYLSYRGGLGFKRQHQINKAFLMKMLWNLTTKHDDLWCRVLYSKYERNNDLRDFVTSQPYDSPLWKTLARIWGKFQSHVVKQIGDGSLTNFWLDKWGPNNVSLINFSTNLYVDTTIAVKDMVDHTGNWDFTFLLGNLPSNIVNRIIALPTPHETDGPDTFGWGGTSIHNFYVKSAYDLIAENIAGWKKPQDGRVKLNYDGACKELGEFAGCGGLFRDSDGRWIKGFTRKIGAFDALHVEMWGMYLGIDIAWRNGLSHLTVESDSKVLINMITNKCNIKGHTPSLIRRIQEFLQKDWQIRFVHTWREGNRSARWLANFSLTSISWNLVIMESPPSELRQLLFDDFSGACMPKSIGLIP
ncbi:hypothetical protein TSUD_73850 [Trifolium subterraneum]|uniref:RNase H type-1 domain-containing protein n=1 Tax=Trifolium subterraneum TaxID=3900 RepID=A0A2Z6LKV2_TRISU|nr:hypothetical protein TSUD_73850 [Trifolium subterraneum]